jgi:glycosyltransferase involved in cell wall biosynthesis
MANLIAKLRKILGSGLVPSAYYLVMRLIWWVLFKTRKHDETAPKVTVVIPVYNVEQYLADCLRSVRSQSYSNFEIIAVNDGATDRSAEILQQFASTTANLRIVTQHNQGLGAARNSGVKAITETDYLMFLDSDDLLPAGAIARYVAQAQKTESKLVVGKAVCFYGVRYFDRTSTAKFFRSNLELTDLNSHPEFLGDATSWNKLYDFDFWQEHKLAFPVGVAYEDMTLVCTAYLAAKKFDVLKTKSYFWRVRAEGESLSKRTRELKSLQDRLLSIEQISKLLELANRKGLIEKHVIESYQARVISMDLQLFAPAIADTDEEFFTEFKTRVSKILASADESVWANAAGKHRAAVWAAIHGNRDQTIKQLQS